MGRSRLLAGVFLLATLTSNAPATAFPADLVFLTLAGPRVAPMFVGQTYGGTLAAGGPAPIGRVGIPNQTVVILVDGVTTRQVATGPDGSYSAAISLAAPGAHTVEAVAYAETSAETRSAPLVVHTVADALSVGRGLACLRYPSAPPMCWQPGVVPALIPGLNERVNVLDAAGHRSCALPASSPSGYCWGAPILGNGTSTPSTTPVAVSGITNLVDVSVGNLHTCAVLSDTTAHCWGDENAGELGNGAAGLTLVPVGVVGLSGAVAISAGDEAHTCALLADGTARCWGGDSAGELGNGPGGGSDVPGMVSGLTNAFGIAAGGEHTCALRRDGSPVCWGNNFQGSLGDGTNTNREAPVPVAGIGSAVDITTGSHFSCALLSDASIRCWGQNYTGELGNGTTSHSNVPVPVTGLNSVVDIDAGGSNACALLSDGTVRCWGAGYGTTPVAVVGLP